MTPKALARVAAIDDLRRMAQRRLPRLAFDFIDGGAESEAALAANRNAFASLRLTPRALVDVRQRDTSVSLFGRRYGGGLGIAPVGMADIAGHGTDLALARAAAAHRVPFLVSTAATTTLERLAEAAGGYGWYQLYVSTDEAVSDDLLARAEAAGYEVLVVTVDVAVPGKRDRDVRNGFQLPFRLDAGTLWDLCRRPAWSLSMAARGAPSFDNLARYAPAGAGAQSLAAFMAAQITGGFTWDHLERLRQRWPHRLVVKGVMAAEDALRLAGLGVDGIIVSNHGGRQCDGAPATLDALAVVREALAGHAVAVMVDGGIRRGGDVVRAFAMGAAFTFAARPFLYGAAAAGEAGVGRAFAILEQETDRALGMVGRPALADVDEGVLWRPGGAGG